MEKPIILVVDDDPANATALAEYLHMSDFKTMIVPSGERALRQLELARPDLILLDVLMPGIDGFETCRRLKEYETIRDIPVIFMSALSETVDKVRGFEVGGVDYLTKPVYYEEVLARIKAHLTIRRLQRQLQTQNTRLQENNEHLQQEIAIRKRMEEKLRCYHNRLEAMVEERTIELVETNEHLQQEIAEHKLAEQALRASEQRYRLLAENVADGIVIIQERKLVFVNDALCTMFGYTLDQLLRMNPVDLVRNTYKELARKRIELAEKGSPKPKQYWQVLCVTGDGREIWVETHRSVIEWEGKSAIFVIVRDITERKLRETAIKEERNHLQRENITLRATLQDRYKFGEIIGKSPAMQEVYELIIKASASGANVVIQGETGVGKELAAWTIHHLSKCRKNAFVVVNCGAVTASLFEREFFGHRKGAFTGADRDKQGYFDRAHQGTLFLDELEELSPAGQAALLRAIDIGEYIPVGDSTNKKVDIRIIAATKRNLENMYQQGLLRKDFYYRINVITITVPPLRERKEDIPLLIEHFLGKYHTGAPHPVISGRLMEQFVVYDWPGNVRELQNKIQRYLAIGQPDLPAASDMASVNTLSLLVPGDMLGIPDNLGLYEVLNRLEKQMILHALKHNKGKKQDAAAMLRIDRRTLYKKMKKYGIERSQYGNE